MHTPEQARALWCPMVRIARREVIEHRTGYQEIGGDERVIVGGCNTDAIGDNRIPASCRCIADKCAMWRWIEPVDKKYITETMEEFNARRAGYCGLAGRPAAI